MEMVTQEIIKSKFKIVARTAHGGDLSGQRLAFVDMTFALLAWDL